MPGTSSALAAATATDRRPEHDLLLACAASCSDAERDRRVSDVLARGVDWDLVLRLARGHGLLALLHWHLDRLGYPDVPVAVARELRDEFRSTSWRNVFLMGELLQLVELFAANGIAAIPFKGPVLAATVYGNVALRQFSDLDVLVQARDRVRARDVLLANGFALYQEWDQVQQFNHEYTLVAKGGRVGVDVHWEVFPQSVFPVQAAGLWERSESATMAGREVATFSPEDTLLILCVHGDTHLWERLKWVCDVARLLDAYPALDWGQVLRRARRSGSERILFLGLSVAGDLLGARIPEDIERRIRADRAVATLATEVIARLFRAEALTAVSLDLERSIFQLRSRPRLWDKIRLAATPNETDWALLPLPASLYPLYYLVRPFRLLIKYSLGRLSG